MVVVNEVGDGAVDDFRHPVSEGVEHVFSITAGAAQAGPDLQNAAGARLYVGHLDPLSNGTVVPPESKSSIWMVY